MASKYASMVSSFCYGHVERMMAQQRGEGVIFELKLVDGGMKSSKDAIESCWRQWSNGHVATAKQRRGYATKRREL